MGGSNGSCGKPSNGCCCCCFIDFKPIEVDERITGWADRIFNKLKVEIVNAGVDIED